MSVKRIFILAWKDIVDSIRTPRLLVIIITPLIIALCIQLFFGNKLTLKIGVYSPNPSQLISTLKQIELVETEVFDSAESLNTAVKNDFVEVGVILPENFDLLLANDRKPRVDFLLADNSREGQVGLSLIQQTIQILSPDSLKIESTITVLKPDVLPGISLRGDLSIDQYAIILWLIMGLVGNGVMLVPTLIVEEQERKTLDALMLSPASYYDIAAGKALVGVLYCMISSSLILMVQGGVSGNILFTVGLIILGSFVLSLLGVLLGSLSGNLHVLNSYGSLFVFILTLPAFIGMLGPNPVIQYLQFLPTYPLTQAIVQIVSGQSEKALPSLAVIFLECLVILGVVVWSLRRREKSR
ncbi:MAG: ABC transporter permease [Chloroflexi bacterium]|nr:ABC transporter permease [Chloroflexota bacterium]